MKTMSTFLNVDLDINSRSSLEPLLQELDERVAVLYSESKPRKHFAVIEVARLWRKPTADKTIAALCDLIENLSPKSRRIWKLSHQKIFNIGVELPANERATYSSISNDSLSKISSLGATLILTCYRGE